MGNLNEALQIGVSIPQAFTDDAVDMKLVRSHVQRAEEIGFDSVWVQEQIIGSTPVLEPMSLLCYVAALTRRVRLGTAVIITTLRNPVHLAKAYATVDQMSDGRLIAGLALGGRERDYPLFSADKALRVAQFLDTVGVIKALWTEDRAEYEGRTIQLNGVPMDPKPVQKPHPPLWFGGRHPAGFSRVAVHADGWIGAGSTASSQFKEHVELLRRELEFAGRDSASLSIGKRVYIAVDDDENRAESRMRKWFGKRYGNPELAKEVAIWGTAERCVKGLQEIVNFGAGMLMLDTVIDQMDHLDILSRDVIPRLEKRPMDL